MGVVDDYYGGYDNIAIWTNDDGETDFEGKHLSISVSTAKNSL